MSDIATNLQAVRARISQAALQSGRKPGTVGLLAVSKTWPAERIRQAAAAGQRAFGESYAQEAAGKIAALSALSLEWHFIGPLQSNKTRFVAEHFDWVHSIERTRTAERLCAQRPSALPPLQVCVQVNVSGETSKHGCSPEEALTLCHAMAALPRLRLRGLMALPAQTPDTTAQREAFRHLRQLFETLSAEGLAVDTLSMGMSHDLEAAVAEGATLVRVGAAIFGERTHA